MSHPTSSSLFFFEQGTPVLIRDKDGEKKGREERIGRKTFGIGSLFCSFPSVAFPAQHLAVLDDGAAAVAPRGDVVALHELQVELLAAEGTDVVLLFPNG